MAPARRLEVLRQLSDEQYALLQSPYLLVVPTVTRVPALRPADQDYDSIINPRNEEAYKGRLCPQHCSVIVLHGY